MSREGHLQRMADMFSPKFDANGLLTAVVSHAETGELLMVAHMNAEAIAKTRQTGRAHFWSRSRQSLWLKGETSGHFLNVQQILVDCDQDCLWLKALPEGPACHTGAPSCFFRTLSNEGLEPL
jgi:phosphoribosyl-AMP cyclohydrolase